MSEGSESATKGAPLSHSNLVSEFVNHALNALSESVDESLNKFTSGAGLASPKPWDKVCPINIDKASELFRVLQSTISETGLDSFLNDCISSNFPAERENQFNEIIESATQSVLNPVCSILGARADTSEVGSLLRPSVIASLLSLCGEDFQEESEILEQQINEGCSLGQYEPIPPSTHWPEAKPRRVKEVELLLDNYGSAVENCHFLEEILLEEVNLGRMKVFGFASEFRGVVTPVALIPKGSCPPEKARQRAKHFRVIEDYKRSHINQKASNFSQTLSLPKYSDIQMLIQTLLKKGYEQGKPLKAFTLDVKSAFRAVGISPKEAPSLNIRCGDKVFRHLRLAFGHRNSPFCFSRIAGAVHRAIVSLLHTWSLSSYLDLTSGLLYVDDMLYISTERSILLSMALTMLIWRLCGFTLAYEKIQVGHTNKFLGFQVTFSCDKPQAALTVPHSKITELLKLTHQILSKGQITPKRLSKLTGKLVWALQCYPLLKPYLGSCFQCIAMLERKHLMSARLPRMLREDLRFIEKFFRVTTPESLYFEIPVEPTYPESVRLVGCDASLHSLAGYVYCCKTWRYWRCEVAKLPSKLKKEIMKAKSNTSHSDICALELLACLASLYLLTDMKGHFHAKSINSPIIVQSDNDGAVKIIRSMFSRLLCESPRKRKSAKVLQHVKPTAKALAEFLDRSLAVSTRANYKSITSIYEKFVSPEPAFPLRIEHLQKFICTMTKTTDGKQDYKYSSIKTYIKALRSRNASSGFSLDGSAEHGLKAALRSAKRAIGPEAEDRKIPLSLHEVKGLSSLGMVPGLKTDLRSLQVASLCAIFGLFRARETLKLLRGDIDVRPDMVIITIRQSKTDQWQDHDLLFPNLSYSDWLEGLKIALQFLKGSANPDQWGYNDLFIEQYGRWTSDCYKRYLDNVTEEYTHLYAASMVSEESPR
ncbi:hypothetical protein FOL47_001456, partial [Perkinsus chesapeaki]